ncbi:MAG: class I SAM-dependent methyltransferase [Alphaproteobacteria bacterium]
MTGWSALRARYRDLRDAADRGVPLADAWAAFGTEARAVAGTCPEHLTLLLAEIERRFAGIDRAQVAILDHGCGSGVTVMVLAALGYTNVRGVDVGGDPSTLNRIARSALGHADDRFQIYDGDRLPIADACIDVVLSQQVLEHVRPAVFERYYSEEARVLRPGGIAYHQVPHRLAPYDSHSRTWLLHYLPRPLFMGVLRLFRSDVATLESHLYLRWPWRHRRMVRRAIGPCTDLTLSRLKTVRTLETYEGARSLRRLIDRSIDLPLIGGAIGGALTWFVQIDTVAVRRNEA